MELNPYSVAIVTVGWSLVAIMWFYLGRDEAATRRRTALMKRIGLDPKTVSLNDPKTVDLGVLVRRRCRGCAAANLCERWLAGEVEGDHAFCPNAATFDALAR